MNKFKFGGMVLFAAVFLIVFATIVIAGQIGIGGDTQAGDEYDVGTMQVGKTGHAKEAAQDFKIVLNGEELIFSVAPLVIDGRMMVPACELAERLGAFVQWDEEMTKMTIIHFTDVSRDDWFFSHVRDGLRFGLIEDSGGGRFEPNRNMTAAEFITMLGRLHEYGNETIGKPGEGLCYERYFEWVIEMGIVVEEVHGELISDAYVTRELMAIVVVRYISIFELWSLVQFREHETIPVFFQDNELISHWARGAPGRLAEEHLHVRNPEFHVLYFRPQDYATRTEALMLLTSIASRLHD